MSMTHDEAMDVDGERAVVLSPGALAVQEKSRLEVLIQMAHVHRRRIEVFRASVLSLCTLNEHVAEQCLYALPRTGKGGKKVNIEGPSVRMAEIVQKSWKNCAVFARIVDTTAEYATAQATFIDFEDLTMVTKEAKRRVLGTHGDARMLAENAAVSIASRNAILAGVPRAIWNEAYEKAKATAAGTLATLEQRRNDALAFLVEHGVDEARVFAAVDVTGPSDIGLEQLALLRTLVGQVKRGEMSYDEAFPRVGDPRKEPSKGMAGLRARAEEQATARDPGSVGTSPGGPSVADAAPGTEAGAESRQRGAQTPSRVVLRDTTTPGAPIVYVGPAPEPMCGVAGCIAESVIHDAERGHLCYEHAKEVGL